MPINVLLFGAPGSGKGTISELLVNNYGFVHISPGNLLREEVRNQTPLGLQCASIMSTGNLIPDELVVDIVCSRLTKPEVYTRGVLLDGFPRTLRQAMALVNRGFKVDVLIMLNVKPQLLLDRCLQRRIDPITNKIYNIVSDPPPPEIVHRLQIRSDDTKERHERRMAIYEKQKLALMQHFKDVIVNVDASPSVILVYKQVSEAINSQIRKKNKGKHVKIKCHL